jgi:hypothetical protein
MDNSHFRELRSYLFRPHKLSDMPAAFLRFVDAQIIPRIDFKGKKLDKKKELATQIIHALVLSGVAGAVVSDGRRKEAGVRLRVEVWDAVIEAGLAKVCLGSEMSGFRTRYRATGQLLELFDGWRLGDLIDLNLGRNTETEVPTSHALVVLSRGSRDPFTGRPLPPEERREALSLVDYVSAHAQRDRLGNPEPLAVKNGLDQLRRMEDLIERINRTNLRHAWEASSVDPDTGTERVFQPNVCLRQVHAGDLFRACRYYCWSPLSGQNLPKAQRRTIRIDGEAAAELDFSCLHIRMLYHLKGQNPEGDLYGIQTVVPGSPTSGEEYEMIRDVVKRATNICLNTSSRKQAEAAVWKLIKDEDCDGLNAAAVVAGIEHAHPEIADRLFTDCGPDLMTADGKIMLHILAEFVANLGKPALAIHDSIICKASDVEVAEQVMREAYQAFMLEEPVIRRAF